MIDHRSEQSAYGTPPILSRLLLGYCNDRHFNEGDKKRRSEEKYMFEHDKYESV